MKYGKIICDPIEGKELIGKTVIASRHYNPLKNNEDIFIRGTLIDTSETLNIPFKVAIGGDKTECSYYNFVSEVIDTSPKYRPYRSLEELVPNWIARYDNGTEYFFNFPTIWVRRKGDDRFFTAIYGGDSKGVFLSHMLGEISYEDLFEGYTFVDLSPCGILCSEHFN